MERSESVKEDVRAKMVRSNERSKDSKEAREEQARQLRAKEIRDREAQEELRALERHRIKVRFLNFILENFLG